MASDTSSGMQDKLELPHSNQDAMGNVPGMPVTLGLDTIRQ